jgi:hypothetical protein
MVLNDFFRVLVKLMGLEIPVLGDGRAGELLDRPRAYLA